MNTKELGRYGENIAANFLENKDYKILERNYFRNLTGVSDEEIDIIAKKDDTICFIEVKTVNSASGGFFVPEDKVNMEKQQKIAKLAQVWLDEHNVFSQFKWQIDIVAIVVDLSAQKAKVRHFKNI